MVTYFSSELVCRMWQMTQQGGWSSSNPAPNGTEIYWLGQNFLLTGKYIFLNTSWCCIHFCPRISILSSNFTKYSTVNWLIISRNSWHLLSLICPEISPSEETLHYDPECYFTCFIMLIQMKDYARIYNPSVSTPFCIQDSRIQAIKHLINTSILN